VYFRGWFVIDLVAILPFDIAGCVANDPAVSNWSAIRLVRRAAKRKRDFYQTHAF
tara:strand:- start:365 stop:529 length:165 start_codon:yes stop_codon:yes gene_type:complete